MPKRIAACVVAFGGLALLAAVTASARLDDGLGTSSAGATAELTVTANGNVAQATASCTGPGASGRVDFGDGTVVALTAASGTVNHAYQTPGTHTVTLTCADQNGSSSTSSVTVTTTPGTSNPSPPTTTSTTPAPAQAPMPLGRTVLLAARTKTRSCTLGVNPDRRCSPGAYYSGLTKAVLCSSSFRAGAIPGVDDATRSAVEREYGLPARHGSTLKVDRIVPLALGGSNDIANLFPQKASSHSGAPAKDKLESKLHTMVCAGQMGLRAAQRGIASNWHALYVRIVASAR
jgi:hypothetical protein